MPETTTKRKLRYILERLGDHRPLYHLTDEEAAKALRAIEFIAAVELTGYETRIRHRHLCTICGKQPSHYMNVRRCKPCQRLYNKALRAEKRKRHLEVMAERAGEVRQEREAEK